MTGLFLSFEGIDGSGKSTQARLLADRLRAAGRQVVLTREPGGSPGAEEIRRLLVEGAAHRWSAETELLLFNAARRDHVERVIVPALAAGRVVITDRFADSTRVYQGERGGLRALCDRLHAEVIGLEPARTFILDMPAEAALARGLARERARERGRDRGGAGAEDRFEAMGLGLQTRLRAGFRALAAEFPDRCRVVDATGAADAVAAEIAALAEEVL